mmetsp:Transcript_102336/g.325151  ORF Transcript_102336/g.325151 Transcript_102336/m.325151 type:complete len:341 (+) Transcript_102336:153-1175(+)
MPRNVVRAALQVPKLLHDDVVLGLALPGDLAHGRAPPDDAALPLRLALPGPLNEEAVPEQHGREREERRHRGVEVLDVQQAQPRGHRHEGQVQVGEKGPAEAPAEDAQPPGDRLRRRPLRLHHAVEAEGGPLLQVQGHRVLVGLGVGLAMDSNEKVQKADAENHHSSDKEDEGNRDLGRGAVGAQRQDLVDAVAVAQEEEPEGSNDDGLPIVWVLVQGQETVREAQKGEQADDQYSSDLLERMEDRHDASNPQAAQLVRPEGVEQLKPPEQRDRSEDAGVGVQLQGPHGGPGEGVEHEDHSQVDIVPAVQEVVAGVAHEGVAASLADLSSRLPEGGHQDE